MAQRKRGPGKLTSEKRAKFLELYATGKTVRKAAHAIGVSHVAIFVLIKRDPEFAAAYAEAKELSLDHVEDSIHELACGGNLTAMFGLLRAKRPAVWRENVAVQHSGSIDFAGAFAAAMDQVTRGSQPSATEH